MNSPITREPTRIATARPTPILVIAIVGFVVAFMSNLLLKFDARSSCSIMAYRSRICPKRSIRSTITSLSIQCFRTSPFRIALDLFHQKGEQLLQTCKTDSFARVRIFQGCAPLVRCFCAPKPQQVGAIFLCTWVACHQGCHLHSFYQARVSTTSVHRQELTCFS